MTDPLALQGGILTLRNVLLVLGLYMVVVLVIAYYANKHLSVEPEDYYLGGGLGTLVLTGTVLATWYSTFAFLGGPGTYYTSGTSWLYFAFFNITGALLIWVVGTRFWLLGQKFGHITPSDLVAGFYEEDDGVRILVAAIAILALVPYAVIQLTGAAQALVGAMGSPQYFTWGVVALMVMVTFYLYVGGLRAVAWIDTLQGAIFMSLLVITAGVVALWAGGIETGFSLALENNEDLWVFTESESPGAWYTGALIWTVAWVFIPHMWQRMLMAKSPKVIAKTSILSGTAALWIITFSAVIIGGVSSGMIPELPDGIPSDGLMTYVYTEIFPAGALFIVVAAFAAGMSTISSQILTSSSIFVRDVVKRPFRPEMASTREGQIGRYFTVVFSAIVLAFALSPAAEQAIIPLATDGVALALLYLPCVVGLFVWEGASTAGAKWSLLLGLVFMQLSIWTPFGAIFPFFGPPVYGLLFATLVYYVVSKVTTPVPMAHQNEYREVLIKGMRVHDPSATDAVPGDD
ncbi:sodium:solute symporter family protein [Halomarina ordinaria]|uniref:Sodium:solute symporter n=1 Tax=Halomarina ordinaria TaxID=3033939 RepID=A0ABD5UBI9_9EURY|nr:sodium:solute symporter family protein [Halomarina sp. PSRA2]